MRIVEKTYCLIENRVLQYTGGHIYDKTRVLLVYLPEMWKSEARHAEERHTP